MWRTHTHLSVTNTVCQGRDWREMQWAAEIHKDCCTESIHSAPEGYANRSWGEMLRGKCWEEIMRVLLLLSNGVQKARYYISLSCSLMLSLIHLMQFKTSLFHFLLHNFSYGKLTLLKVQFVGKQVSGNLLKGSVRESTKEEETVQQASLYLICM